MHQVLFSYAADLAVYPEIQIIVLLLFILLMLRNEETALKMLRYWKGSTIQLGTKNSFPSLKSFLHERIHEMSTGLI